MKKINIDPIGILCYAKSFVYACRNHELVNENDAKRQLEYIALQEAEMNHNLRNDRSLLSSVASQNNMFFMVSTVTAFMVAALKIFESGIGISGSEKNLLKDYPWYYTVAAILGICIIGWGLVEISKYNASKREFRINRLKRFKNKLRSKIFHHDSDLDNQRLSVRLRVYIRIQDWWYQHVSKRRSDSTGGRRAILILKLIFWLLFFIGLVWIIVRLF